MFRPPGRWPAVLAAALGLVAAGALATAALVVDVRPAAVPVLAAELRSPDVVLAEDGVPPVPSPVTGAVPGPAVLARPATTPPAPRAVAPTRTPRPTPAPQCATIRVAAPALRADAAVLTPPTGAGVEQGCPQSQGPESMGSP